MSAVIMIQKQFQLSMENEFEERQNSQHTFPIRITPINFNHRQLHKIRINHKKLPSQFFTNPKSMPDLHLPPRTPSLDAWSRRRQKTAGLTEDGGSKEATRSLKEYRSMQRMRQKSQQRKINDLFIETEDLGVTFSRLPMRRVQKSCNKKETSKVYLKKKCTQPCEQLTHSKNEQAHGRTMKIEYLVKGSQGISVRKNNHPINTLRQIKSQRM